MCLSQYNLLEFQNEGNDFLIVLALMYDIVASLVQIAIAIIKGLLVLYIDNYHQRFRKQR